MTDIVLAMMLMVAMLLLGAALLAIALLYRGHKRTREQITDLRAQVAAQQIAAITGGGPISGGEGGGDTSEPEPVRRKGHLSLYKGGGVVAAFAALAESLRIFGHRHRAITITAGTTVATAGAAAAIFLTGTGEAADHLPETTLAAPEPTSMDENQSDTAPGEEEAPTGNPLADRDGGQGADRQEADPDYRSLALLPRPRVAESVQAGTGTPLEPAAETPVAPAPDTPAEEAETPLTPTPGEEPAPTPPATEEPEDEGILCFHTGRLMDLCLLEPAR